MDIVLQQFCNDNGFLHFVCSAQQASTISVAHRRRQETTAHGWTNFVKTAQRLELSVQEEMR